jgi:hypothetical protein
VIAHARAFSNAPFFSSAHFPGIPARRDVCFGERAMRFVSFVASTLVVIACSDAPVQPTTDAGVEASVPEADAGFVPATHPAAPTITSAGGAVLANPKVAVVTFSNEPLATQLETFAQTLGASSYWPATTSEYGVGKIEYAGFVHVDAPPATTLSQDALESWIASELDGTHPEWPAYDPSIIYAIVMPQGAGIQVDGAPPCASSPAYHYEIDSGTQHIVYAAINRCDPFVGLSGIDYLTAGLSHELVEASTDPLYLSAPAFDGPAPKYNDWNLATGGEVADFCTPNTDVYFKPSDFPFTVQRSWSNAAATAGHDPCVPAAPGPYFAAVPVLSDTLHGTYYGQAFTSEGAHVALGASVDVAVDLFSDTLMDAPFSVSATSSANLAFSWDRTSGSNGDVLTLTITRKGDAKNTTGIDFFDVVAVQGSRVVKWVGAVGN